MLNGEQLELIKQWSYPRRHLTNDNGLNEYDIEQIISLLNIFSRTQDQVVQDLTPCDQI